MVILLIIYSASLVDSEYEGEPSKREEKQHEDS